MGQNRPLRNVLAKVRASLVVPMRFPAPIVRLPEGKLLDGLTARIHQGERSQVVFLEATADVTVPIHTHAEEWGVVLEGEIEMTIAGKTEVHRAGEERHIPAQVPHAFSWKRGTRAILFFDERERVKYKGAGIE